MAKIKKGDLVQVISGAKPERGGDHADPQMQGDKGEHDKDHAKDERELHAPGREHDQQVAFGVAQRKRQADSRGERRKQPEQAPHLPPLIRPPSRRPAAFVKPGYCSVDTHFVTRSRVSLKLRTAARLSDTAGTSMRSPLPDICFSVPSVAAAGLERASKYRLIQSVDA